MSLAASFFALGAPLSADLPEKKGKVVTSFGNSAAHIDLGSGDLKVVPLGFMAHSFLPLPSSASLFVAIEKWGPSAAVVDFKSGTILQKLENKNAAHFFGHGFYDEKHKAYFITKVSRKTQMGYLAIYDGTTHKFLGRHDIAVGALHEGRLLADGTALVACAGVKNLGYFYNSKAEDVEPASLRRIDLDSGKVMATYFLPDPHQNLSHFTVRPDGSLVCCTVQKPRSPVSRGEIFFSHLDRPEFIACSWPDDEVANIKGEMLSHAFDDAGKTLCVANPDSDSVLLIDIEEKRLLKRYTHKAKGVIYDPDARHFVLTGKGVWTLRDGDIGKENLVYPLRDLPIIFSVHSVYEA